MNTPPVKDAHRYELALQIGQEALRQQKWDQAIAAFRMALDGLPDDPRGYDGLGDGCLGLDLPKQALACFKLAAICAPNDPTYLIKIAVIQEQMEQKDEAARSLVAVGDMYQSLNRWDEAIGYWQQAARLSPRLIGPHHRLANAHRHQGNVEEVVKNYAAVADILEGRGQLIPALDFRHQTLLMAPNSLLVKKALVRTWRLAASQNDSEISNSANNENHVPVARSGELLNVMSDLAHWQLTMATRQDTESDRASPTKLYQNILVGQALLHESQGKAGLAISSFEQAIASGFRLPAAYFVLGYLFKLVDKNKEASYAFALASSDPFYLQGVKLID